MGGLLLPYSNQHERDEHGAINHHATDADYTVFTSWRATWDYKDNKHPLKYLILDQNAIENTSKADGLLKLIAILQATWITLNVAVLGIGGVHVTQLEIATVAFAVMAGLTYIANWWKPKDVNQSTILSSFCDGKPKSPNQVRLYWLWLWAPVRAWRDTQRTQVIQRVRNDSVHMTGHASVMTALLAVSSLIFGGFHCFAWDSQFPSQTELYCWRVSCIITAVLPATTLWISTRLSRRSKAAFSDLFDQNNSKLTTALTFGDDGGSDEWWKHILDPGFDLSNADTSAVVANPTREEDFNSDERAPQCLIDDLGEDVDLRNSCLFFINHLRKLFELWEKAFRGGESILEESQTELRQRCTSIEDYWQASRFADFWLAYEKFVGENSRSPTNIIKLWLVLDSWAKHTSHHVQLREPRPIRR